MVARSGASTVAELAAIGRPSILVPLPHAIDQDQFANAGVLERAGGALTAHAAAGTFGVLADDAVAEPSTQSAASLLAAWGKELPAVVVAAPDQEVVAKSFRNLDRVAVTSPGELEVAAVVWARSLLVTEAALPLVQGRAS